MANSEKYPVPALPEFTGKEITVESRDSIDGLIRARHGEQENVVHPLSLLKDPIVNEASEEMRRLNVEVSDESPLSESYGNGSLLDGLCLAVPSANEVGSSKKVPASDNKSLVNRLRDWIRRS
jgi:hypothetical protein